MSVDSDWDVEKHRVEHECDEHWELRKRFLETHKGKFPEDELVCLAQVFTNVELLGCRYPQETMNLIAELSREVAKEYREKQKTKLQRTFVKASDAASSKVKGLTAPKRTTATRPSTSGEAEVDGDEGTGRRASKRPKLCGEQPFGNLVLLQYPNQASQAVIETSANISGQQVEWKYDTDNNNKCRCQIFIGGKKLSEGVGKSKKISKSEAAQSGLQTLHKYYYLIEVKQKWRDNLESNTDLKSGSSEQKSSDKPAECLPNDNIGAKLMKLMGWAGGGLGKSQQGITEPITVTRRISRQGFGMKLSTNNKMAFKKKCRETLQQYIKDGSKNDLVFAGFDNEERAIMHQTARQVGLKSQSYGSKDQRTLLVSRKIDPRDLVVELLELGGNTDKYVLRAPTAS